MPTGTIGLRSRRDLQDPFPEQSQCPGQRLHGGIGFRLAPYGDPDWEGTRRGLALEPPAGGEGLRDLDGCFALHVTLAALLGRYGYGERRRLAPSAGETTSCSAR